MESMVVLLIFAGLLPFLLLLPQIFVRMPRRRRLAILLNLAVWGYEIFFFAAVCGALPHASVHFGGGLGDLLFLFLLMGLILGHIVALSIMAYKTSRPGWFLLPAGFAVLLLVNMHLTAARGNEENGYMTAGNCTGLYYDAEARHQEKLRQQELEEASKPRKPEFATRFESYLYDAERGDPGAQNRVADCYGRGDGVEQNDSLSVMWSRRSAEAGYAMGQRNLGVNYYYGLHGLAADYAEAIKWLRPAAEAGIDDAQYLMGLCYGRGEGVEQDDGESLRWLRLAAWQGQELAQKALREKGLTW